MRLIVCLSGLILLLTGAAWAQIDPDPDGIGIYADRDATITSFNADPEEAFEVYLCLTRPHGGYGVLAWECQIVQPENVVVWGWNISGINWINAGNPPDFAVAYGTAPLPGADVVLLMTFIIYTLDTSPAEFYIQASSMDSGEFGLPVYIPQYPLPMHFRPLHPFPRGPNHPVFAVNGTVVTPTQRSSWGEVKALFD